MSSTIGNWYMYDKCPDRMLVLQLTLQAGAVVRVNQN
jgi:hypothetical protein